MKHEPTVRVVQGCGEGPSTFNNSWVELCNIKRYVAEMHDAKGNTVCLYFVKA